MQREELVRQVQAANDAVADAAQRYSLTLSEADRAAHGHAAMDLRAAEKALVDFDRERAMVELAQAKARFGAATRTALAEATVHPETGDLMIASVDTSGAVLRHPEVIAARADLDAAYAQVAALEKTAA